MLCLCDIMFSANVIINLSTMPNPVRRVSSLHVNILPTCINLLEGRYKFDILLVNIEMFGCFCICCNCVYAGFDDQLLKLMLLKRSSLGVAVEENVIQKQQPNINTSSSILEILSMVWAYNLFLFIYNHALVSIYHRVPLL